MTGSTMWASRPILVAFATLALSACTTPMAASSSGHTMKDGMSMSSCPCCAKMKAQSQAEDKTPNCCSGMTDSKGGCGCCGGGDGKPMICQPKN